MSNKPHFKTAFTLIEVIIAVMIVSVVIIALTQMYSNNAHIFSTYKKQITTNQYLSLLISNENYGYEDADLYLDDLAAEFDLDDELRKLLKKKKVELNYQELHRIYMSKSEDEDDAFESDSKIVLEVGKSVLRVEDSSSFLLRIRQQ